MQLKFPSFPLSYNYLLSVVPYVLLGVGLVFHVAAMGNFGLRADKPECQMWDEASLQYESVSSFLSSHPSLLPEGVQLEEAVPDNHYRKWATACHFGQSWLFFGVWFCILSSFLLLSPALFQIDAPKTRFALPWVSLSFCFVMFWELISMYCFFGLGDAWTYSYTCKLTGEGDSLSGLCGYMDKHGAFLSTPHESIAKYFSDIHVLPFFQVYALSSYADSCATLITLGLVFSAVACPIVWLQYKDFKPKSKEGGGETKPHSPYLQQMSTKMEHTGRGVGLPMTFGVPGIENYYEEDAHGPEDLSVRF